MSLKLVKDSTVNVVSDVIKDYLAKSAMKPGDSTKYRLLNGIPNADKAKHDGDMLYPASITIPLRAVIFDPGSENNVTVGAIKSVSDRGDITWVKYHINPTKNNPFFFLKGGPENEIQEALELVHENASNPYRDKSVVAIFEKVDDAAEAKERSKKRNFLFDSLQAIRGWNYDELRIAGAAYNIPTSLEKDVIKDKLESIAEKDPKKFYQTIDSEEMKVKSIISMAKDASVITYNGVEHKWIFSGTDEVICILERREGVSEIDQLAQVLISAKNGPAMRGKIEKLISASNKK